MKLFRKFMIAMYFGRYIFSKRGPILIDRAAVSNFSLLIIVISIIYGFLEYDSTESTILLLVSFMWIVYSTFPTKISYFQQKPVMWNELSRFDKWYLGSAHMNIGNVQVPIEQINWEEWIEINEYYKQKFK